MQEAFLHAIIGTNVLEDVPRKNLVQLPRHEAHTDATQPNNSRDGDEVGPDVLPHSICGLGDLERSVYAEDIQRDLNLLDLQRGVDHQSQVGNADTDGLNGVLHAQRIPDDDELVEETEDEEGEEGWDSFVLRLDLRVVYPATVQARLKPAEDIAEYCEL